ncbi:MAG: hypothetical protein ACR2N7_07020 [Acidimicrobiia bacterium]
MEDSVDTILRSVRELSASINGLPEDDPKRERLVRERESLREQAAAMADQHRHPVSVENEISMIEQRLAEIDAMTITKGYSEKHLKHTIQDPGAYSHNINKLLAEEHKAEVAELEDRLAHLRTLVPNDQAP